MPDSVAAFMRSSTPEALALFLSIMAFMSASTFSSPFMTSLSCFSSATCFSHDWKLTMSSPLLLPVHIFPNTLFAPSACACDMQAIFSSISFTAPPDAFWNLASSTSHFQDCSTWPMRPCEEYAALRPSTPLTFFSDLSFMSMSSFSILSHSFSILSRMVLSALPLTICENQPWTTLCSMALPLLLAKPMSIFEDLCFALSWKASS
mmetsp:Transcript_95013/g.245462  ORF Transcript_95013/g.245462 Transcript_95013/m.245462 type:complete len:206 (+) Transcript_95013:612-1229(+)